MLIDIGERVLAARLAVGMSKAELGRRIGGSGYQLIHGIETGRQMPRLATLQRIAAGLAVPLAELLPRAQETRP